MTNIVKYKGTKDTGIDLSDAVVTTPLKLSTTSGVTLAAFTTDVIGTTPEDGFISVDIGGTVYKIPVWLDNA